MEPDPVVLAGVTPTTGPGKELRGKSTGKYPRGKLDGGLPDGVTPNGGCKALLLLLLLLLLVPPA
jgi:hypothetical protein